MRKKSRRNTRRTNNLKKRKIRRHRTRRLRRGGTSNERYPIPDNIKTSIWAEMMKNYGDDPRFDEADALLENMSYDPYYRSKFTGDSFEGVEDKEYKQGMDKIQAFFKYGSFY